MLQTTPHAVPAAPLEAIQRLQAEMLPMPQQELPPEHSFGPGFYARTLRIPAGTVIVGRTHAREHIFMLTQGEMELCTEDGRQHVKAPFMAVCRAGLKRVGVALTDVVGSNIHITDETDLEKLESLLIASELVAIDAPAAHRLEGGV